LTARRAPEKSKVGEKEKYFIPFNQLYFLKADCGVPSRLAKATLKGLGLDGLSSLFFKNTPVSPGKPADNILLLLAHRWV